MPAVRTLLHNGVVLGPDPADEPTALAIEGDRIVWVGDERGAGAYSAADEVVDLDGALLTPAFVDSHVHTVQAGFRLTELDLHGSTSRTDLLDRLAAHASVATQGSVLLGQGWDETLWSDNRPPTAQEVDIATGGHRTFLSRIDGHSAVVSTALAAAVPGVESQDGWSADGRVERDAHHAVRAVLGGLVGPEQRLTAARHAVRTMAAQGLVGFHENAAPHIGPEYEVALVRQAAEEAGLRVTVYWGELGALDAAQRLGVRGLAGDLNADGAIGSRTAALHGSYADRDRHCGHGYLSATQIAEHVVLCTEAGLQAGFHCIGDAAMEAVSEGFERAAGVVGPDRVRAGRHRLEHVEMPSAAVIQVLSRLGVTASVQPVFDALWGGPDGMYAERLGERWKGMNPFRSMLEAGVRLAFGSDSPVTPIGPWGAVRAAVQHQDPDQRLGVRAAFEAHTRGGWRAGLDDDSGTLEVGLRADLAVWDLAEALGSDGLPELDAELPTLRRTISAGRTIHDVEVDA
ncbi:Putative amidohydrolase ytcJ [metagenome]|uniref:Amidohydrolase ytcJ n=1 Tax=metagenome TaxID=256318 RepID=A0A2P2CDG2_9ZZZZ